MTRAETDDWFVTEGLPLEKLMARSELRLLQGALELLPVRCREVFQLRKIDGLSQREVAQKMGITEDTVERQVAKGVRAAAKVRIGGTFEAGNVEGFARLVQAGFGLTVQFYEDRILMSGAAR